MSTRKVPGQLLITTVPRAVIQGARCADADPNLFGVLYVRDSLQRDHTAEYDLLGGDYDIPTQQRTACTRPARGGRRNLPRYHNARQEHTP